MQDIKPWHKLALLAIFVMVLLKFILVPWQSWVSDTASQISYFKGLQQKLSQAQQRSEQLKQQHELISADYRSLLKQLLPQSPDSSIEVLRYVEAKAKQHQLKLTNRAVGEVQLEPLPALPVALTLQGHPELIYAFLHDIETGSPRLLISSMSVIKPGLSVQFINLRLDARVLLAPDSQEPVQ